MTTNQPITNAVYGRRATEPKRPKRAPRRPSPGTLLGDRIPAETRAALERLVGEATKPRRRRRRRARQGS